MYISEVYLGPCQTSTVEQVRFTNGVFWGKLKTVLNSYYRNICFWLLSQKDLRRSFYPVLEQCFYHIDARQLICSANQLADFYIIGVMFLNGLMYKKYLIL